MDKAELQKVEPKPVTPETVQYIFESLRYSYSTGGMDSKVYEFLMRCLIVGDIEGNFWTIGTQTGSWYRKENDKWVKADPPKILMMAVPVEELKKIESEGKNVAPVQESPMPSQPAVAPVPETVGPAQPVVTPTPATETPPVQFCTNCGAKISEASKFCLECGTAVKRK